MKNVITIVDALMRLLADSEKMGYAQGGVEIAKILQEYFIAYPELASRDSFAIPDEYTDSNGTTWRKVEV